MSVGEFMTYILRKWKWMTLLLVLGWGVALAVYKISPKVYRANAVVEIGQLMGSPIVDVKTFVEKSKHSPEFKGVRLVPIYQAKNMMQVLTEHKSKEMAVQKIEAALTPALEEHKSLINIYTQYVKELEAKVPTQKINWNKSSFTREELEIANIERNVERNKVYAHPLMTYESKIIGSIQASNGPVSPKLSVLLIMSTLFSLAAFIVINLFILQKKEAQKR